MRRSVKLSQNFLRNPKLIEVLVAGSSINAKDTVLDIGAGRGSITNVLAKRAGKVVAYEADERLATSLIAQFVVQPQVRVIMQDFLVSPFPTEAYKVFANIPFSLTADIVHKLLDGFNPPSDAYLIMQREAALKFAGAINRQTLFATLRGPWFAMTIAHQFKSSDFVPQPKVSVVLFQIERRAEPLIAASDAEAYRDFVSYLFNHANPNILPSLQKLFPVKQFELAESALTGKIVAKPSQLELHDWISLFRAFQLSANDDQLRIVHGASSKLQAEANSIEKHHRTRSASNWRMAT